MHDRYYTEPSEEKKLEIHFLKNRRGGTVAMVHNGDDNFLKMWEQYAKFNEMESTVFPYFAPKHSSEFQQHKNQKVIKLDVKDADDFGMQIATMPHDKDGYVIIDGSVYDKKVANHIVEKGKELATDLLFGNDRALVKGDLIRQLRSQTDFVITKVSDTGTATARRSPSEKKPVHHNGQTNKPNRAFQKKQKKQRKANRRK